MYDWDDIVTIVTKRRRDDTEQKKRMIEVRDRFNGDYVIPLTDVRGEPNMPTTLPNLVADGIEITALRAAAVEPMISAPALDMNKATGVRSIQMAEDRRRAWKGCWHHSQMSLLRRRAFRHLGGYGSMAFVVVPDFTNGRARIETRDPLTAYPDERDPDDIRAVHNVAFVYGRTAEWILSEHGPRLNDTVAKHIRASVGQDAMWDVVEWIDHDQVVMGIIGRKDVRERRLPTGTHAGSPSQLLARWDNRAGMCTAVVGRRVTLDRVAGQMDAMLPTYDLANRIMALEVDSMERSIYPDRYVLASDNREPMLVSGKWKDGREGGMNRITNANAIGYLQSQPSQMTNVVVDRLESSIRQSAGVNALASGLQPGSLRTGRALDSFQGFSIEPRLIEMDDIMARALTMVNECVVDVEKGYFGGKTITSYTGEASDQGLLEYKPRELWECRWNAVNYPLPGADLNNMTLAAGQMIGAKLGSRRDAMAIHPAISDPDRSLREIMIEDLDAAILQGLQQQMASGLPMTVAATIKRKVLAGTPLELAIEEADQEARELQAREAESAAEAAPGIAPGAPLAAQPPAEEIAPQMNSNPELNGLRELLNSLDASAPREAGGIR